MRDEISAAVLFLTRLIEKGENFNHDQLEHFKLNLSEVLVERFENHWFPDKPYKGQGYRCIRVNGVNRRDPTLEKAARATGIKYEDMKLPCELTVWVDPNEVCCRFGEHKGSFCTLASFNDKDMSGSGSEDSQPEEFPVSKHSPAANVIHESTTNVKLASRQNRNSVKGGGSNSGRKGGNGGSGGGSGGSRRHSHHHHHLHHHLHAPYHHHQGGSAASWHHHHHHLGASASWLHGPGAAGLWQPPPPSRYHWPKTAPLKV